MYKAYEVIAIEDGWRKEVKTYLTYQEAATAAKAFSHCACSIRETTVGKLPPLIESRYQRKRKGKRRVIDDCGCGLPAIGRDGTDGDEGIGPVF